MDNYTRGRMLGQGTFAVVYKGTDKNGKEVALKELFPDDKGTEGKKGIHPTALREIKLLKELRHENIIGLLDTYPKKKKTVVLVMEYMHSDLEAVVKDQNLVLSAADIKSYLQMLLRGLQACHAAWVLHRDVKPNNCLLAPDGTLKLADFGLSRVYGSPDSRYTCLVFAQWYRAPELFFGARQYTSAVDMWAAGCVLAELMLRRPWFEGVCDVDVLSKVFAVFGTPTDSTWPGAKDLPFYLQFTEAKPVPLKQLFPTAGADALDLLARMMALDPAKRISATEALAHPYFSNSPLPTPPPRLPRPIKREDNPLQNGPEPRLDLKGARDRPGVAAEDARPTKHSRSGTLSADALARAASPRTQH